MNFFSYCRKLYFNYFKKNINEPNDDVTVKTHTTGNKRRSIISSDEEIIVKRRRILPTVSGKGFENLSYFTSSSVPIIDLAIDSLHMEENKLDDSLRKRKVEPLKEVNNRAMGNGSVLNFKQEEIPNVSIKFTSDSTQKSPDKICSTLCLTKVHNLQGRAMYIKLLKKSCSSKLVQNKRDSVNFSAKYSILKKKNHSTDYDYSNRSELLPLTKNQTIVINDSKLSNKTIIDLTLDEDNDEEQRQEIASNIMSSPSVQCFKSNFIAKNCSIADEEYLSNLLRKYESKMRCKKSEISHIQKAIQNNKEDFNKVLSEILEKRLTLKEHTEVEDLSKKPSYEIAPITNTITTAINKIVSSKKDPLVQIKDTAIKLQDIRTLEASSWLNDEVINAYMNLIKIRSESSPENYPKVHCFNTFLYEQLQKKGYNSVRRWTKKIDVFDCALLIVPIHLGNHWCLIEIKVKEKCICYYDSMGSPNNRCLETMLQYMINEFKDKKNEILETSEWKLINIPSTEIPQQKNFYDCGVFACTYAEHLTRQAIFNFDQEHMSYFRIKMMYEILTGKLLL